MCGVSSCQSFGPCIGCIFAHFPWCFPCADMCGLLPQTTSLGIHQPRGDFHVGVVIPLAIICRTKLIMGVQVFVCDQCAGIHRGMGVHISQVRSLPPYCIACVCLMWLRSYLLGLVLRRFAPSISTTGKRTGASAHVCVCVWVCVCGCARVCGCLYVCVRVCVYVSS